MWLGVFPLLLALDGRVAAGEATEQGDSPSQWLAAAGKSDEWVQATAKCRELLARLRVDDPLVQRHLVRVQDLAGLVRRVDRFD